MNDLDRLFRHLVDVLANKDPSRLSAPFQISEIYQSILPYRQFKKQLGFECSEDYEMAMLRLFSGEANYAEVEPNEVKEQLVVEAQALNPNPGAFREFAAARVKLNQEAVKTVRGSSRAYAPPASLSVEDAGQWGRFAPPEEQPTEPIFKPPVFQTIEEAAPATVPVPAPKAPEAACPSCNKALPANRTVLFCPFCGCRVGPISCPNCGDEVEIGWSFCASCGRGCTGG